MHLHLPKPLHGWREFAGEVGIIVIGVLIALAAEQVVEGWSWHHKVGVVRQSLMGELANDRARWEVDVKQAKCALQEAGSLDAWARGRSNGPSGQPSGLTVRSSLMFTMHTANWTLAASSQTLDHFPMREQLAFAALYAGLANRQKELDQTTDAMDRIQTLLPLASDPQGRRELREALGQVRAAIGGLLDNEAYMRRHFDALGVQPDASDFAADFSKSSCA